METLHIIQQEPSPQSDASSILVVDDNEMNRDLLRKRLERDGYAVFEAENGRVALEVMQQQAIDLVLLDLMMPVMDGYETLNAIKSNDATMHIPVVVITAVDETSGAVQCIESGAEDYLGKPFNPTILRARVRSCLAKKHLHDLEKQRKEDIRNRNVILEETVRKQVLEITAAQHAAIFAMSKLAESKDPETGAHLDRMREYCLILAKQLAMKPHYAQEITPAFQANIYAASPLHDIGKVGVPDNVLLKPGKLTDEEWVVMRSHTTIGAETLRAVDRQYPDSDFVKIGIEIAECHHEKWNGAGYPFGLKGDAIPLSARILALGDVYDALTSKRCYKDAFSHDKSREIILQDSGTHFDPDVVQAFLDQEEEFIRVRKEFQDPG